MDHTGQKGRALLRWKMLTEWVECNLWKWNHETSLLFFLLFLPNYLYSTIHRIFPVHHVSSFRSTYLPFGHFLLFQCAIPLRPFSPHSSLLIFQFSGYHNSLLCLEQIIPTTTTCSFLPLFWAQRLPAWKAPFFWCSWEVAATVGGGGARGTYKNANSAPEDKKRRFYGQLQRHLHSLLCKS